MTPTARTLIELRRDGWTPDVVERWIPGCNVRRDLFGVGDVLAVRPGEPPLLIQATTDSHHANRLGKAKKEARLRAWLGSGSRFEVWSWAKRDGRWGCRRTPLVLDDLDIRAIPPPRRKPKKAEPSLFASSAIPTHVLAVSDREMMTRLAEQQPVSGHGRMIVGGSKPATGSKCGDKLPDAGNVNIESIGACEMLEADCVSVGDDSDTFSELSP